MNDIAIRLAGCRAALYRVHPLCCPYLTGPIAAKKEWLLGYGFAQRLGELEQAKLRVALLEIEASR